MQHIVLIWELGGGLGHLRRIAALANHLDRDGFSLSVVLRELSDLATVKWPNEVRFFQAPLARLPSESIGAISSYSEILFTNGFDNIKQVESLTSAWADLLDLLSPDLIVLDHAPMALLTANMLSIPTVRIGTGFFAPPTTLPYPVFRDWEAVDTDRLHKVDAWLQWILDQLCAQAELTIRPYCHWFKPSLDLVSSWPALDHYAAYRLQHDITYIGNERAVGDEGEVIAWDDLFSSNLLVYLKRDYAAINTVLDSLKKINANSIVFIAGITVEEARSLTHGRIKVTHQPLHLNIMLEQADLFICHAGSGSVALSLEKKVPVLLLPITAEQLIFSNLVKNLGVGQFMLEQQLEPLPSTVTQMISDPNINKSLFDLLLQNHHFQQDAIEVAALKIVDMANMLAK